jgi:hypothetical protein
MLFGDTNHFAIEAMVEPGLSAPSSVWGRMRVWCQGQFLGDYSEEHCALYPAYRLFKRLDSNLPNLWKKEFNELSDAALFDLLDGLLFGYHGDVELDDNRTLEQCQIDAEAFGKFSFLTNWGEQFDRAGKSFIVCPEASTVNVLNRSSPSEGLVSLHAPVSSVQEAIHEFCGWFEQLQAQLSVARGA